MRDREACHVRPWLIRPESRINRRGEMAGQASDGVSDGAAIRPSTRAFTPTNFSYGEPIDFEFLRNAPINEAGVVYLFGCLAPRLGYCVEAIQTAFPDCEAKRRDPDGRFRRVRIEFEFESKNFQLHQHDPTGCDVIVCWRHNWPDCPLHVIELSKELPTPSKSAA